MIKKIILWSFYAFLIFGAVYLPSIPLPFYVACLMLAFLILAHIYYDKNILYKNLKLSYKQKTEMLDDIFKNTPDLIFAKNKDLKYISANESMISIFGNSKNRIVGSFDTVLMPKNAEQIMQYDKEVLKTGRPIRYEQTLDFPDKPAKIFQIVKSPIYDEKGEICGVFGISRDITELKEVEMQKDNFVETLTHDLKAPTTAQIKALDLILNEGFGKISNEQREILNCTLNSCKYMLSMIKNILSTYKYDKGIKTLTYSTFDFSKLLEESIDELKYLSEDNKLKLIVHCDENLPSVKADIIEIKRVVTNLLSNAFFYALSETDVNIHVSNNGNSFEFKVSTESNPLTKEEVKNLFTKFFTGVAKFRPVGTGLGLYLSKMIVEAHHGEMIYESYESTGNTFGFRLFID